MSEPITAQRNLERVMGLWPSAGLTADWKNLFLSHFRNANQDWLRYAIERVKFSKGSHVPELKWFADEFEAIRREHSNTGRQTAKTAAERAAEREAELERDRIEVEAAWVNIRRQMANLSDDAVLRLKTAICRRPLLASLVAGTERPVAEWPTLSLGVAHQIAVEQGLIGGRA